MSRCGCSSKCTCIIQAGTGASVSGVGSAENPYVIGLSGGGGGAGLPTGGTTGQVLAKSSNADGAVSWQNQASGVPTGGTSGQVLTRSGTTGLVWSTVTGGSGSGLPVGGATGTFLRKNSGTDGDAGWSTVATVKTALGLDDVVHATGGSALALPISTAVATELTEFVKMWVYTEGDDPPLDSELDSAYSWIVLAKPAP